MRFNPATSVATLPRWRQAGAQPETPAPPIITVLPPPPQGSTGDPPVTAGNLPAVISPKKPKLNFGLVKQKEPSASPASDYPILPDLDGKLAEIAHAFLEAQAAEEAAKGAKESNRLELVTASRPFHFTVNSGRQEVPSSISVLVPRTEFREAGEVRVTFKNAYKKLDETGFENLQNSIGATLAEEYFCQTFEFTINSELIPADKMQAVIDAVNDLAQRLDIAPAVQVATCYKPLEEWHSARYRRLTAEQNLQLEAMDPKGFCTVAVGPVRGKKSK